MEVFYGILIFGLIVLNVWLILKFIDIANNMNDIRSILIDQRRKSKYPCTDFSKVPNYGDGVDKNGNEYFEIANIDKHELWRNRISIGRFQGFVSAEKHSGDSCNIGVYDKNVKIGTILGINKSFYDYLIENGEALNIQGYLDIISETGEFYGYFYIVGILNNVSSIVNSQQI